MTEQLPSLSAADLDAEGGTALPNKEVVSLLDLNANVDLALDLAAPIDLAAAANLNVAAPIDASVGANVLSVGSEATGLSQQQTLIDQGITGEANANAPQDSTLDQSDDTVGGGSTTAPTDGGTGGTTAPAAGGATTDPSALASNLADGNLLNVNVDAAADLDAAAPIAGAVAANANVAAPIDASVAANVGSVGSEATAAAVQTAVVHQDLDADANATADQTSDIKQ